MKKKLIFLSLVFAILMLVEILSLNCVVKASTETREGSYLK